MARRGANITILQFSGRHIGALQLRRGQRALDVAGCYSAEGAWPSPEDRASALKAFAAEHQLASDQIYTVLPRHDMTARILNLPSHDISEIEGMVRLGAEEFVPYALDDLIVDQTILERLDDGHALVLAVFVHRDVVEQHIATLRAAGLDAEQIFVSTACLSGAAQAAYPDAAEPFALVNLASGGLEALVMRRGVLVYDRGIAAVQDWTHLAEGDPEVGEELLVEVRSSLSAYRRESPDGAGVEQVLVCSDGFDVAAAVRVLEETGGYNVAAADLSGIAQAADAPGLRIPPALLGGALSALGKNPVSINLIPKTVRQARASALGRKKAIAWSVLLVAGLVAVLALYRVEIHQRQQLIEKLDAQIAEVRPLAEQVKRKRNNLRLLEKRVDRTATPLQILALISSQCDPDEISFLEYEYERGKEIKIEAQVTDLAKSTEFVERIQALGAEDPDLGFLKDARRGDMTEQRLHTRRVHKFEVIIPLPESDVEFDAADEEF